MLRRFAQNILIILDLKKLIRRDYQIMKQMFCNTIFNKYVSHEVVENQLNVLFNCLFIFIEKLFLFFFDIKFRFNIINK
jgi:hypothetical protein